MKNLRKGHLSQGLALVVSRPVKLQTGFVFELPETTIQTVAVVTPFDFRNVMSGWRANFAVPMLPDTDQPDVRNVRGRAARLDDVHRRPDDLANVAPRRLDVDRDRRAARRQVEVVRVEVDDRVVDRRRDAGVGVAGVRQAVVIGVAGGGAAVRRSAGEAPGRLLRIAEAVVVAVGDDVDERLGGVGLAVRIGRQQRDDVVARRQGTGIEVDRSARPRRGCRSTAPMRGG